MKVFKFGGASVNDAGGIKNLAHIVTNEKEDLVIVVSAFGKTTNALEKVLKSWLTGNKDYKDELDNIYNYHLSIADELLASDNLAKGRIENSFSRLNKYLTSTKASGYDFEYDQIVSYGEVWSTSDCFRIP